MYEFSEIIFIQFESYSNLFLAGTLLSTSDRRNLHAFDCHQLVSKNNHVLSHRQKEK